MFFAFFLMLFSSSFNFPPVLFHIFVCYFRVLFSLHIFLFVSPDILFWFLFLFFSFHVLSFSSLLMFLHLLWHHHLWASAALSLPALGGEWVGG